MTREEEIKFAANEDILYRDSVVAIDRFIAGAEWADEHPKSPWISVEDRLPEYGELVLAVIEGEVCLCECATDDGVWFERGLTTDKPTYWMPIPEIPKGGEQ